MIQECFMKKMNWLFRTEKFFGLAGYDSQSSFSNSNLQQKISRIYKTKFNFSKRWICSLTYSFNWKSYLDFRIHRSRSGISDTVFLGWSWFVSKRDIKVWLIFRPVSFWIDCAVSCWVNPSCVRWFRNF